jgi:uncharacterized membrane protein YbhN (UPF0104 family)
LGFCLLGSASLLGLPALSQRILHLNASQSLGFGLILGMLPVAAVILLFLKKEIVFKTKRFTMPSIHHAFLLLSIAVLDWICAIAVLWVLIPHPDALSISAFGAAYLGAHFLGNVSQTPGGMAVFDCFAFAVSGYLSLGAICCRDDSACSV